MLEKLINDVIEIIVDKINNDKYSEKLKAQLIDPLILHIVDRFYPYIIITSIIFILIFVILLFIFFITLRHLKI